MAMKEGLIGRKKGMTQVFGEDGNLIPVTVVEAGPCTVVGLRTKPTHGYDALQLGFELQSGSFGQDDRPLRTFVQDSQPAYVEVRARESASGGWDLVVTAYDTCFPY